MLIAILLEEFCSHSLHFRGVSPQTIKRYRENIGYYYKYSRISTIDEVTKDNVLSFFLYGRRDRNWRARTFRTYHMSLLVFFRWCQKQGHLETNFVEDMELPKVEESERRGLSQEQASRLLECVYNYPYEREFQRWRNHAIFACFIFTGLRRNELINLRLMDVDVINRTIFVRRGKGGKDRMIPINSTLVNILIRYIDARKSEGKTCPGFFTSAKRNIAFTEHGLKKTVERMKKVSGVAFSTHILRHTFARFMFEGGCDIYTLSKLMGHNDIKTTSGYMFASEIQLRKEIMKHPLHTISN